MLPSTVSLVCCFNRDDANMIVCHCNVIKCQDIRSAAQESALGVAVGGSARVTAGQIFKALGEKPNCARCVPLMTSVIQDALQTGAAACAGCPCPTEQDIGVPVPATALADKEVAR